MADEAASHVNPNGPPLNAMAMIAVVPRLRRSAGFFSACCNVEVSSSVVWVMVSDEVT